MATVYTIHQPKPDHLAKVVDQMRVLGAPTIKVVDCGDHYQALEGTHRLAAADQLGLTPVSDVLDQDHEIEITGFDWYQADPQLWAGTRYPAGEVAGELHSAHQAAIFNFSL